MPKHKVVCLLPARNCEWDLEGYFESCAQVADAVVALDDGSTDATRSHLASHPLVALLLTNPVRDDYRGWDDSFNRNLLLQAAAELRPEWVLSLDADERLDPGDAAALLELIEHEALRGHAYGLRVCRMIEDLEHYDLDRPWVCRLFAWEPGCRFPEARLHFAPVPTSIPRQRWVKTTIRIQHLSGLTEGRRRDRWAKYGQVDPKRLWQSSYDHLLAPPGRVRQWEARPKDLPLIHNSRKRNGYTVDAGATLSVIVHLDGSPSALGTAEVLSSGTCDCRMETIIVSSVPHTVADVPRGPRVKLVGAPAGCSSAEARNIGLRAASGRFVFFPASEADIRPSSLAARTRAHEAGYAMVTGTVANRTDTPAGWASYLLGHAHELPGAPPGAVRTTKMHCSHLRAAVLASGGWPTGPGADLRVNAALLEQGYGAVRTAGVTVAHAWPGSGRALLQRCWIEGRLRAREERSRGVDGATRVLWRDLGYVPRRLLRLAFSAYRWGGPARVRLGAALPLVAAALTAQWAGLWFELLHTAWLSPSAYPSTTTSGREPRRVPGDVER